MAEKTLSEKMRDWLLGTGEVSKAGDAIKKRQSKIDEEVAKQMGDDPKNGKHVPWDSK